MMNSVPNVEVTEYIAAEETPPKKARGEARLSRRTKPKSGWRWSNHMVEFLAGGRDKATYYYTKRLIDIILASVILVLLLPMLLAIGFIIKLDSVGPIFFVHDRVGARRRRLPDGSIGWEIQRFPFYKFRSMKSDADESMHKAHIEAYMNGDLDTDNIDGAKVKIKNDPRITRVGNFIRRTSLDELPQLLNVIRGEMSLVGPRPVPVYEAEGYEAWHRARLAALPGITGYWQIKGRGYVSFEEMIRLDLDYINNASLWLDFKILLLTIPAILSGEGAE